MLENKLRFINPCELMTVSETLEVKPRFTDSCRPMTISEINMSRFLKQLQSDFDNVFFKAMMESTHSSGLSGKVGANVRK